LGLVEDDEMVGMVEAADGFVEVVCPDAQSEINERATAATKIVHATRLSKWSFRRRLLRHLRRSPDDISRVVDTNAQ